MAAEISEITESNQILSDLLGEIRAQGVIIREMKAELDAFKPVLDQFRTPAGAYSAWRRAGRR